MRRTVFVPLTGRVFLFLRRVSWRDIRRGIGILGLRRREWDMGFWGDLPTLDNEVFGVMYRAMDVWLVGVDVRGLLETPGE